MRIAALVSFVLLALASCKGGDSTQNDEAMVALAGELRETRKLLEETRKEQKALVVELQPLRDMAEVLKTNPGVSRAGLMTQSGQTATDEVDKELRDAHATSEDLDRGGSSSADAELARRVRTQAVGLYDSINPSLDVLELRRGKVASARFRVRFSEFQRTKLLIDTAYAKENTGALRRLKMQIRMRQKVK